MYTTLQETGLASVQPHAVVQLWSPCCHWPPKSGALVLKADVEVDRCDFVVLDFGQALQEGHIMHDGSAP
jgi:hypothetical protein